MEKPFDEELIGTVIKDIGVGYSFIYIVTDKGTLTIESTNDKTTRHQHSPDLYLDWEEKK